MAIKRFKDLTSKEAKNLSFYISLILSLIIFCYSYTQLYYEFGPIFRYLICFFICLIDLFYFYNLFCIMFEVDIKKLNEDFEKMKKLEILDKLDYRYFTEVTLDFEDLDEIDEIFSSAINISEVEFYAILTRKNEIILLISNKHTKRFYFITVDSGFFFDNFIF